MWYVIWVATGSEKHVVKSIRESLGDPGRYYNDCWVPAHLERRKRNGVYGTVSRVLFPGYVFVDTDDAGALSMALKKSRDPELFKNCLKLLCNDNVFLSITPDEERIIRRLTANSSDRKTVGISTAVVKNGVLVILDGPLKGFEKYITSVDRHKHKCRLSMNLFGEERVITAGIDVVEGVLPSGM